MKLNAYVLLEQLKGVEDHYFHSDPLNSMLLYLSVLREGIPIRSDCVYIASASNLFMLPEVTVPYTLLCAGKASPRYMQDGYCDLLCCRKEFTVSMLFEQVHSIFVKYNTWEDRLLDALIQKKGLQALCQLSLPVFENPIMLLGENHELLAVAEEGEKYKLPYECRQRDTDYLSEKVLDVLLQDPEYPRTFYYETPEFYIDVEGAECVYMNIFIDGLYAARICVDSITRYATNGDKLSLCTLSKVIKSALEQESYTSYNSLVIFKKHLRDFMQDPATVSMEILYKNLHRLHWEDKDDYFCIALEPNERDFQAKSIIHDCHMMEKSYPGCITLYLEEKILLVCNLRICPFNRNELLADIVYTVREKLMRSGISTEFHTFFSLPSYYLQAIAALETGKLHNDTIWQYKFEDYVLRFLLEKGSNALPLEVLLPQGLMKILEHDREHGTSYYQTLRTYMENDMSTAKAIEALYVHRSTFKYRMMRVQEMLQMDLEKPDVKLYLLILFQIIPIP